MMLSVFSRFIFIISLASLCTSNGETAVNETAVKETNTTETTGNENPTPLVWDSKPNIIIIFTDEHSLRTIGRYRKLLNSTQQFPFGENVKVGTKNIDKLARKGAVLTNFYTVSPRCTPSRGSFMSGTYSRKNGAIDNGDALFEDTLTFSQVLEEEFGYSTAYFGKVRFVHAIQHWYIQNCDLIRLIQNELKKWHLHGTKMNATNFGAPEGRSFGFNNTKYQWSSGHWKFIEENTDGSLKGYTFKDGEEKFQNSSKTTYTTDFLTDRAIDFMREQKAKNEKFALMLSIPDPHGPDKVRPPFDAMFNNMNFTVPRNALANYEMKPALPGWSFIKKKSKMRDVPLSEVAESVANMEARDFFQEKYRNIFGMVKVIDSNVGKIMNVLKELQIKRNTMVVFTSDHGDLLGEHGRFDKGVPYKTSAGIPLIIQWPREIKKGTIIKTAQTNIDFAPTLLNLLGSNSTDLGFDGMDFSERILNKNLPDDAEQLRFMEDAGGRWAAAVNQRYKLVLSIASPPWLLDGEVDSDELYNFYKAEGYEEISSSMQEALYDTMRENNFVSWENGKSMMLDKPACEETENQLDGPYTFMICKDFAEYPKRQECEKDPNLLHLCPVSCGECVEDSQGEILVQKQKLSCINIDANDPTIGCIDESISTFCAKTCENFS